MFEVVADGEPIHSKKATGRFPDRGEIVAALRARFGLSQTDFAALLGISVGTLRNWEQRRRRPDGPAKILLRVAAIHPEALLSVAKRPTRQRAHRSAA